MTRWLLALCLLLPACSDCGSVPNPDGDDAGVSVGDGDGDLQFCGNDDDCAPGYLCEGGLCMAAPPSDAGQGGDGDGDGGAPEPAEVTILPEDQIEFGAQLIGVSVTRDVQVKNTGGSPLTILAVILDQDGDEFSVAPEGSLQEVLLPDEVVLLQIAHTPADGTPDEAELKVLHDGPGSITTIDLFAEFKGTAVFSVTSDLAVLEPSITTYDFGEVETDVPHLTTLWLRNVGATDSIIEITDLTLTPPTAGFALESDPELPFLLGAWSTGLCPGGDGAVCPPFADGCQGDVCVDEQGDPLAGLPLPISFTTSGLSAVATLTIELDRGDGPEQHDVVLTGLPTQPGLVVTPTEVVFGSALVDGLVPPEVTVSISNDGAGPLLITRVELPANPAFAVTPSAPIPTQVGHPPLSMPSGAAPLELAVRFLPTAAEGYAGVITLHTNDASAAVYPITVSGSGVVCQANAGVDPLTGECACLPGFNACGGQCLPDSPTTCGDQCTDCTAPLSGSGTAASCVDGGCSYSCEERHFDLNDDLDTPGAAGWNGCEYLCPSPLSDQAIAACQADPNLSCEQCNGVDDDCDGERDEGMSPDSADAVASNGGACTNATDLGEVDATTSGATSNWQYSIYPTGDDDWFKITVHEGLDSPSCIQEIPCIEGGTERYRTRFQLAAPAGESFSLEVRVPQKTVANYDTCTGTLEPGNPLTGTDITHDWSRSSDLLDCVLCGLFDVACYPGGYGCAFDDRQVYFVRVRPAPGASQSFSCLPYTLTVTTTAIAP